LAEARLVAPGEWIGASSRKSPLVDRWFPGRDHFSGNALFTALDRLDGVALPLTLRISR